MEQLGVDVECLILYLLVELGVLDLEFNQSLRYFKFFFFRGNQFFLESSFGSDNIIVLILHFSHLGNKPVFLLLRFNNCDISINELLVELSHLEVEAFLRRIVDPTLIRVSIRKLSQRRDADTVLP
mmetsp:Transcript_22984/g.35484  ORF Transcript_22984/g.35484 Transcript_22984/m.35484 type:complete len:126 (-) Transcript_22984:1355-1732(-)